MGNWQTLRDHVTSKYKIRDDKGDFLVLIFSLRDNRSQFVFLQRHTLMNSTEDWCSIESPIGKFDQINLTGLTRAVGDLVVGGLSCEGDMLTLKHCVPLANMDANEIERPMLLITSSADDLERRFVGGDAY